MLQAFIDRFPRALSLGWTLQPDAHPHRYDSFKCKERWHCYTVYPPSWYQRRFGSVTCVHWAGMDISIPDSFWDNDYLTGKYKVEARQDFLDALDDLVVETREKRSRWETDSSSESDITLLEGCDAGDVDLEDSEEETSKEETKFEYAEEEFEYAEETTKGETTKGETTKGETTKGETAKGEVREEDAVDRESTGTLSIPPEELARYTKPPNPLVTQIQSEHRITYLKKIASSHHVPGYTKCSNVEELRMLLLNKLNF